MRRVAVSCLRAASFDADSTIRAFDYNVEESLGDGTFVDRPSPVVVMLSQ